VNFEELLREMEAIRKRMTERMSIEMGDLDRLIQEGQLDGSWQVEPFEESGVKGFIARGYFQTPDPMRRPEAIPNPLNPLKPLKPLPGEPRVPFYDVRDEKDRVELYVELPGIESNEVDLEFSPGELKVKAKNFQTTIQLPERNLDTGNAVKTHENGVLSITIPRHPKDMDEPMLL
jgi:HSP20 family molecular chaperone IbpA